MRSINTCRVTLGSLLIKFSSFSKLKRIGLDQGLFLPPPPFFYNFRQENVQSLLKSKLMFMALFIGFSAGSS